MDRTRIRCAPAPGWRVQALLVLSVLFGLVAMHGMAPMAPSSTSAHAMPASSAPPHAMPIGQQASSGGSCHHLRHGGSGHLQHADATCAATGTATAPVLPAPAPGPVAAAAPGRPSWQPAPASLGSRAPPDLSELQLLRI
ncbi:DUF6153 family protein [Streptomyces sp. NPDC048650]|uniref:DUF6153 family protein n=1 Tax=Streptomyces sp. NPDC048650 TaxID=3365583 RepID=UPI003719D8E1